MLLVWHVVFKNLLDKSQRFSFWRPSQPSLELLEKTRWVKQKAKVSAVAVLYDVLMCMFEGARWWRSSTWRSVSLQQPEFHQHVERRWCRVAEWYCVSVCTSSHPQVTVFRSFVFLDWVPQRFLIKSRRLLEQDFAGQVLFLNSIRKLNEAKHGLTIVLSCLPLIF